MKSVSAQPSTTITRTQRASAYVLSPLVSLPGILGVGTPVQEAPNLFVVGRIGTAASQVGRSIDRQLAVWRADMRAHEQRGTGGSMHDVVLARAPKSSARRRMKVVQRSRAVGVIESQDELDALLAGHDL